MSDFNRRDFLKTVGGAAAIFSLDAPSRSQTPKNEKTKEMLVYVGTYTSGKSRSEGIYIYKFDAQTGALSPYKTVANVIEPSFLAIDKDRKYLYAVNEILEYEGRKSGAVSAFAIDRKTGDLRFLNKQPSLGGAPCHVSVSENGKFVLVANYLGGNVSVFPVEAGGSLGAAIDSEQHSGAGANRQRQEAPHAHSIILDKKNRFAFVNDLGIDKIMIYRFDDETGKLETNPEQAFYQTKAGAGPRHFKFHPDGKLAFVINELDSTISSLAYDRTRGTLKEIQTVSTLPAGSSLRSNSCADIHVSPNGAFLYGSNRGHDSIVSFKIDETTGNLELVEHVSTQGRTPRNFAIDPTGAFLLAANQNSDSVVAFRIDGKTGKLQPTGNKVTIPSPVCLKLIPQS
ncbi:MAG: lactonase family protein [Acidobacteriota bacterium]|nr:lactonase family protein [Acidobacteriota bacterium]